VRLGGAENGLSVVVATSNRVESLSRLLTSLASGITHDFPWEIVVANNGSVDGTAERLNQNSWQLPLKPLHLPTRGKASALNAALRTAEGRIIVFTDDDVLPSPSWLEEIWTATQEAPEAVLFTGPIFPDYPEETPLWLKDHALSELLYARYEPSKVRGYISPYPAPFGPNFAVRSYAIKNMTFREDLGPSSKNGPLSYDDSEFLAEFRARHSPFVLNGGFWFNPKAFVRHRVRPEQLSFPWIYERCFNNGRSTVCLTGRVVPFAYGGSDILKYSYQDQSRRLVAGAIINYYLGSLFQLRLRNDQQRASDLELYVLRAEFLQDISLLSDSAFHLYQELVSSL